MPSVTCGKFNIHYVEEGKGYPVVLIHGLAGDHTEPDGTLWAADARGRGARLFHQRMASCR
jgi:pimeloyl-ACP methyl ester carboxylesterase